MIGQFIFPTCNHAGLHVSALFKNTARDKSSDLNQQGLEDMYISLKIFRLGKILLETPNFAVIKENQFFELSAKNCPVLAEKKGELLVIAECKRGNGEQYFPQEHQIIYESIEGHEKTVSLLYDQLPITKSNFKKNTILLLAPKVWISGDVNTFICFANSSSIFGPKTKEKNCDISFLNQNGDVLHSITFHIPENDTFVLDIKKTLSGFVELTDKLQFFNVVARVDFVSCVILTIIQNEKTGALALEHSLSPHYYMDGDFQKVRKEAFLLSNQS